jgi:hypothetical protein
MIHFLAEKFHPAAGGSRRVNHHSTEEDREETVRSRGAIYFIGPRAGGCQSAQDGNGRGAHQQGRQGDHRRAEYEFHGYRLRSGRCLTEIGASHMPKRSQALGFFNILLFLF